MASNVSQPVYFHVLLLAFVILHSLPQAKSCANHTLDATFSQLHLPAGCYGPSSITFDHKGEGPYVGAGDGRIFKYDADTTQFKEYCVGNSHRSRKSCDAVDLTKAPTACGRPMGLSFDQKSGDMYYVDAIYGLQRVKSGGGGVAQPVCSSVGGSPLSFPSSVSTGGSNGELYFTDYSRKYNLKNFYSSLTNNTVDSTGRLMTYDTNTKQTKVLADNLNGAAGCVPSKDGSFVLVTELMGKTVKKYWTKGPKAGTSEHFRTLDGFPTGLKATPEGDFWLTMNQMNGDKKTTSPMCIKMDHTGKDLHTVDLSSKYSEQFVTGVEEKAGKLYVGSTSTPYVGVYKL
ncbi:protein STRICTOSIDINE SYNTHASE-LIKE 11-like [Apium graveolens]|uniref:protein STRICTOSIDINE SYNTHASE-LIKE 11-like n=1 Tax=Apium graveolens TaxID=4045 RepID=UPI003D79DC28